MASAIAGPPTVPQVKKALSTTMAKAMNSLASIRIQFNKWIRRLQASPVLAPLLARKSPAITESNKSWAYLLCSVVFKLTN